MSSFRAPATRVMAVRLVLAVAATVPVRVAVLAVVTVRRVRAVLAVAATVVQVRAAASAVAAPRAASALSVPNVLPSVRSVTSRAHPSVLLSVLPNVLRSVLSVRLVSVAVPAVLRVSPWRVKVAAAPAAALKVLAVRAVALTVLVLKARAGVGYFSIPGTRRALPCR